MEKHFFAVQIEKTEINILQKNGEKAFLLFKMEEKKFLSSLIKIHRQLSGGVISVEQKGRARELFFIRWFFLLVSFCC